MASRRVPAQAPRATLNDTPKNEMSEVAQARPRRRSIAAARHGHEDVRGAPLLAPSAVRKASAYRLDDKRATERGASEDSPSQGPTIRYAVGRCPLGCVLIAATDQGVCALLLGEDHQALLTDLQRRFPRATLTPAEPDLARTLTQAIDLVEEPSRDVRLPLDLRGTALQQRVWQALRRIPPGEQVTYGELARRIGKPGCARAVASACAANPIAVAVPCHRVVRSDGHLAGYRWGLERKRWLLEKESEL